VSVSPDGSVYQISLSVSNCTTVNSSNTCATSAVLVAKSTDGGASVPFTLQLRTIPEGSRVKTKQFGARGEVHFQPSGARQAYWLRKSSCDLQRR
jgi:hypothetical protein